MLDWKVNGGVSVVVVVAAAAAAAAVSAWFS